jgi:phosphoribosylformylglycinamidine cyclo-ligase
MTEGFEEFLIGPLQLTLEGRWVTRQRVPDDRPNAEAFMSDLTYAKAGVDIDAGDAFVAKIKERVVATHGPEVIGDFGGFGAAFAPMLTGISEPVLVSGTDGVGTKLMLAHEMRVHHTVGIDLVAMCVNDILTVGARPLFFLDYIATGLLEPEILAQVVSGIAEGCSQGRCALIGGETAEMPDMYEAGSYDLAGFAVGLADKQKLLSVDSVEEGDVLIALSSSGVHSNGFSLVRHVLKSKGLSLDDRPAGLDKSLGETLLTPTRIYSAQIMEVMDSLPLHAAAHITGGGIAGNLIRVLPENLGATINTSSYVRLPVFEWLLNEGVAIHEANKVFNMGIGMILVMAKDASEAAIAKLNAMGEDARVVGRVHAGPHEVKVVD